MPVAKYYHAGMKIFPILATMLAAGLAMAEPPVPAVQQPVQADLMTMTQDARCKQVVVTCLINGQPMRMMLDTGATHTVLHEESAESLKDARWIDTSRMLFRGNSAQRPRLLVANLLAGPAESAEHPFMVMNLGAVRSMMVEKIDGILGMDILRAVPFTFDLRKNEFYWGIPQDAQLTPLYAEADGTGRVIVQGKCGEQTVRMLLDTGSSVTRVVACEWTPGEGAEVGARMGNIDESMGIRLMEGKPGNLELGAGVVAMGITPLLCDARDVPMLGMDALQGLVLVHVPSEETPHGIFLIAQ